MMLTPRQVLVLLAIGGMVTIFGAIGSTMGMKKGSPMMGLVLGALFGPFGLLMIHFDLGMAGSGLRVRCEECDSVISAKARRCPHCGRPQVDNDELPRRRR